MSAAAPDGDARRARGAAAEIVAKHFGSKARRLTRLGGGISNFVFRAGHAEGEFIVRLSADPAKMNHFLKEQWATAEARAAGVPTPEVLEVGNRDGQPYMVERHVTGIIGTNHPRRLAIVEALGRLAARIHGIRTSGFGETFDWSQNQLSRADSWGDFLTGHFRPDERIAVLIDEKMLGRAQAKAVAAVVKSMQGWRGAPSLQHGDLRLKNVLVDREGTITALIDWEDCLSAIGPHWDISVALHDLSIDQKQAFLDGYGMPHDKLSEAAATWKAFNILNYAPYVEQARAEGDERTLAMYRARLSGALDLYSL